MWGRGVYFGNSGKYGWLGWEYGSMEVRNDGGLFLGSSVGDREKGLDKYLGGKVGRIWRGWEEGWEE